MKFIWQMLTCIIVKPRDEQGDILESITTDWGTFWSIERRGLSPYHNTGEIPWINNKMPNYWNKVQRTNAEETIDKRGRYGSIDDTSLWQSDDWRLQSCRGGTGRSLSWAFEFLNVTTALTTKAMRGTSWRRMGKWMYVSGFIYSWIRNKLELHSSAALPSAKMPRYSLDRRLGGSHIRSGRSWKEKILVYRDSNCDPSGFKPVTSATALSWIFGKQWHQT